MNEITLRPPGGCKPDKIELHVVSGIDKGSKQLGNALVDRVAGDTAQAKAFAEQARNTLEPLRKEQPDNAFVAAALAVAYAMLDEKDSALNEAQRAITLLPSNKDRLSGPAFEENLALVEMIIGENSACDRNSYAIVTNAVWWLALQPNAHHAGTFKARSNLGPVAHGSGFPKTLRGKAAVNLRTSFVFRQEN